MDWLNEWLSDMHPMTKRAIVFALAAVLIFTVGFGCGSVTNIKAGVDGYTPAGNNAVQQAPQQNTQTQTPQQNTQTQTPPAEDKTDAPSEDKTDAPSEDKTDAPSEDKTDAPSTGAPQTKEEIIAYFNTAADKVKTDATKVTRNYEDLRHNEEHLQMPSALQSIGSGLISTFLKKNETPVEYTGADIIANYPVAGQEWSSKATAADVAEAKCDDDGTYYNIELKFNESKDPEIGTGAAATFSTIKAEDVYNAASVVKNFESTYYDAVVKVKVDKASGHIVSANYTLPIILNVTAQVLMTLDAQVGMTFEHDYTIEY
ncbi:MAG: hypothetical protein E7558_05535 [Ruminococcaceae bacterium]|nr:hypothetical protein [Oscillospiraceae bacterium]